jgi:hypothetical protein
MPCERKADADRLVEGNERGDGRKYTAVLSSRISEFHQRRLRTAERASARKWDTPDVGAHFLEED